MPGKGATPAERELYRQGVRFGAVCLGIGALVTAAAAPALSRWGGGARLKPLFFVLLFVQGAALLVAPVVRTKAQLVGLAVLDGLARSASSSYPSYLVGVVARSEGGEEAGTLMGILNIGYVFGSLLTSVLVPIGVERLAGGDVSYALSFGGAFAVAAAFCVWGLEEAPEESAEAPAAEWGLDEADPPLLRDYAH